MDLPAFAPGTVWLAGAGPGAPGLLTLLAARGLAEADLILHDALVSDAVLALAGPGATLAFVGKRAGVPSPKQPEITARMVAAARAGLKVLRLKGGDPFTFARGAEEALALAAAGVPFRVVPGVSAGVGGLGWAGVPITHRAVGSAVTFISGRCATGALPEGLNWRALSLGAPTLVLFMALGTLPAIAHRLMAGGRSPGEAVVIVSNATLTTQSVLETTLAAAERDAAGLCVPSPAIVAVGQGAAEARRAVLPFLLNGRGEGQCPAQKPG
jgi:uroporphyrin-III C-methyltransferase